MRLFLSYASEDRRVAEAVYFSLIGNGHTVHFDRTSLKPGDNYDRLLREQIDDADAVVFLISPESVEAGSYSLTELRYAREKWSHPEGHVLPVMIEPTPFDAIPAYLGAVTVLQPEGNIAAEVCGAVQSWKPHPRQQTEPDGLGSKFRSLAILIVMVVVIAIGLGTLFSFVYPTIQSDAGLAVVFLLVAITIVLTGRSLWRLIARVQSR